MTETKAAEPTTDDLVMAMTLQADRDYVRYDFCAKAASRLLSLSREVEAKDAEIARLLGNTTDRENAIRAVGYDDGVESHADRIAELEALLNQWLLSYESEADVPHEETIKALSCG